MATSVSSFKDETDVSSSPAIPFLQAVSRDLQTRYALTGGTATPTSPSSSAAPSSSRSSSRSSSSAPGARTGGTSFADVLTSILGTNRAAMPEQYATLVALIARQVGV